MVVAMLSLLYFTYSYKNKKILNTYLVFIFYVRVDFSNAHDSFFLKQAGRRFIFFDL